MPEDVQFDIDTTITTTRAQYGVEGSRLNQWLMKHSGGLIKSEEQANHVLLGFVIVALILSATLFFNRRSPYDKPVGPFAPVAGPSDPLFKQQP